MPSLSSKCELGCASVTPPRREPVRLALGWLLYTLGAAAAAALVWTNATADTALARIEAPAAPALELARGTYLLEPATSARVFSLASRQPLALRPTEHGVKFEVPGRGIFVVELLAPGERTTLRQRRMLSVSPTLIVTASAAPLATVPGLLLLAGRARAEPVRVTLGGSVFNVVSVWRRLAGIVLDLVGIAAMMILLLLAAPLFPPLAPLFPLAPLAYGWAGNARGRTLGKWLAGTRVVRADGRPLGPVFGLVRTLGGGAAWGLLGAGYLLAALRPSRRALHDLLSRSFVVYD